MTLSFMKEIAKQSGANNMIEIVLVRDDQVVVVAILFKNQLCCVANISLRSSPFSPF